MNKNIPFYNIEDFESYRVDIQNINSEVITLNKEYKERSYPKRFIRELNTDSRLHNLYNCKNTNYKSGSERDMAVACHLVRKGYEDDEIATIIYKAPYEKNNERTESYMITTISKARAKVGDDVIRKLDPWDYLKSLSLTNEEIENVQVEFLIDGLLVKDSLTMISGQHNQGKSILALAIAKYLIEQGIRVIYLDYDMPIQSIGERIKQANINEFLSDKFIYVQCGSLRVGNMRMKSDGWNNFKKSIEGINEHLVIIIDNLKDFSPSNAELNDDTAMVAVMNEIKEVRNIGITVILLHHRDKDGRNAYKNSGSIADALDVGYVLENKKGILELRSFKNRIRVEETHNLEVTEDFVIKNSLSSVEQRLCHEIYVIYDLLLSQSKDKEIILQQEIRDGLKGILSKNRVTHVLKIGIGIFWNINKGKGTSLHYCPIPFYVQNSKNPDIKKEIFRLLKENQLS